MQDKALSLDGKYAELHFSMLSGQLLIYAKGWKHYVALLHMSTVNCYSLAEHS